MDPYSHLRDLSDAHCHVLANSFRKCRYDFACGVITVYFSSTVNLAAATYATTVLNIDGIKLLNDGYYVVMLDGRHRFRSVEMLRYEDNLV